MGKATYKKYKVIKNHIEQFDSKPTFEKIGEEWLTGYVQYLQRRGSRNTTIEKRILDFKSFLRWASKKGYIPALAFEWKPKLKSAQKKVIFLTWKELTKLRNCENPAEPQHTVH